MDKYRIVDDGTPAGKKVFCNGVEVRGVTKVSIEMTCGCTIAYIDVLALNPELDIEPAAASVTRKGAKRG